MPQGNIHRCKAIRAYVARYWVRNKGRRDRYLLRPYSWNKAHVSKPRMFISTLLRIAILQKIYAAMEICNCLSMLKRNAISYLGASSKPSVFIVIVNCGGLEFKMVSVVFFKTFSACPQETPLEELFMNKSQ